MIVDPDVAAISAEKFANPNKRTMHKVFPNQIGIVCVSFDTTAKTFASDDNENDGGEEDNVGLSGGFIACKLHAVMTDSFSG
jgi:hypothetical protein